MDVVGEFQKGEIDGKPCLIYQNVIKPQIHSPNSSDEKHLIQNPLPIQNMTKVAIDSGDNLPPPPLFICPSLRFKLTITIEAKLLDDGGPTPDVDGKLRISHLLGDNMMYGHDILPLFWCNNKEADPKNDCSICNTRKVGTYYYFCVECDQRYHKECVESPLEINYPSHVKHSLQLYNVKTFEHCILSTKKAEVLLYYCALCDIYMHVLCAQAKIPFLIDQPKKHDHTLTLFPRQASLTCNVCGLVDKLHLTYVCRSICDFVAHIDCIHNPQTIRISRHFHGVSFTSSLPSGKWCCGICRREIDSDYGAYSCNVCKDYAVHTRCALRKDIWDGIELEGVPEDKDVEPPFYRIADGIILHFSHGCHMKFETNGVYKENEFCQACVLPINEENFYVCVKCDFILHEKCADAPRKKVHPLHPHPIEQKVVHENHEFECAACMRKSSGFGYVCTINGCDYELDAVCASASEPFNYQVHPHPLFLALDPKKRQYATFASQQEFKR
ncbi:unnamed protein product [Arabidopsis thaliana]|uniref:Zinc finger PHD-type domain-containing protein n=1 Tax=Arabidopsis thaliana TaxID=3702 RepID=A0A5S9WWP5_ARATH|nr:unnamed protein product [Arabidopsis thaliana]